MAIYKLNVDLLKEPENALLQAAKFTDDAVRLLRSVNKSLEGQSGMNVGTVREALSTRADELYNKSAVCLCNLHVGLHYVLTPNTELTDNQAKGALDGISPFILSGEKLISFDHTQYFVENSNEGANTAAIVWSNAGLKSGIKQVGSGLISKGAELVGKYVKPEWGEAMQQIADGIMPDNVDEKYMKQTLEALVGKLANNKKYMEELKAIFDQARTDPLWEVVKKSLTSGEKLADIYDKVKGLDKNEPLYKFFHDEKNLEFLDKLAGKAKWLNKKTGESIDVFDAGETGEFIDKAADVLLTVFKDYTEQLFYIEKIREALNEMGFDNELVNNCIDDLIRKYQNSVLAGWEKAAVESLDKIADKLLSKGLNFVTGGVFSAVDFAVGWGKLLGDAITGLGDQGDIMGQLYASQQYSDALVEQYEKYAAKIRSGSYTQEDVTNCEMYLQIAAEAKISEYELLKELYESVKAWGKGKESVQKYIGDLDNEIVRLKEITGASSGSGGGSW